ncbi:hypothetical protein Mycsm_02118 [Mycobacterium sp. JS623]|uniref:hypothetical protein n=1 Tax=Mycobacterium sp. JS623 TaxID=212767 RepID=UPI0002A585D5|nr:hypothetical protein [Mycobacterium sp. JS623]AGB22479.1 hypothetical protein Mycsm_02118 [Mycobacterium sp. JS623]
MTQHTGAPIFDADQHMYETADALTKYLPEKYSRAVQFANPDPNAVKAAASASAWSGH